MFGQPLEKAKLSSFRVYDLRHALRLFAARAGSAHHLRECSAWPQPADHDAAVVCALAPRWMRALRGRLDWPHKEARAPIGHQKQIGHSGDSEVPDSIGGPSRTRTLDPLIKSQLLYQLS